MEYRLLGPLEVRTGGIALPLGGTKQRALLALLMLDANRVVAVDRLIDDLWGEKPPKTAVATIQVYVSRWRKLLPEGTLQTHRRGYLLNVEPGSIDLERFERLVRDARGSQPGLASELLSEALALWRGPPLAEFAEEPFSQLQAGRLEELRLAALELRLETDLTLGLHKDLVAELEALVANHPHRERLHGLLMLALYRASRQADALATYRRARSALAELGLEPSEPLRELERQILTHDSALELATQPSPPAAEARRLIERRKTVTVLCCGVAGSTALGEARDPEARRLILDRCFEGVRAIVARHGGLVEEMIGDAVVAVFGAPVAHEDDALRALRAAIEMRESLLELGLELRIGINTGEVVTSTNGALVTGDAANVAAWLQRAAGASDVLVGADTLAFVGDAATVEALEPPEPDGIAEPVAAYRLLKVGPLPTQLHRSPFVGRQTELAFLENAWAQAVEDGRSRLVTIVGEPGVGKSRLVAEFVSGIDARVVQGHCLSYGEGITYFPVVDVLRQIDFVPDEPAAAAAIGSLLGDSDVPTSPDEIGWAFRKLLELAAPVVVVFDDVQWGEETFLDLVEQLALVSTATLLCVCVARPELLDRRPGWPVALRLAPLPAPSVEGLFPASVPTSVRQRIKRAAGGNPLFVTEMVAMAAGAGGDVVVPATLRALLAARLDQLEPTERRALERGAVEGELFHLGAVQALDPTETQVATKLMSLVRKELIRPDRATLPDEDGFRFCHLLVRDAAYDAIPKATRAELHERLAVWLDRFRGELVERDEIIGFHLQEAHRYRSELGESDNESRPIGERAASYLAAAGRRASVRGDSHAVANLLERALALGVSDRRERVQLQVELGKALYEIGRIEECEALLAATRDAATGLAERVSTERALVHLAWSRLSSDPKAGPSTFVPLAEGAIMTLKRLGDDVGLAEAERLLGQAFAREGRTEESFAAYGRALVHAQAAGATGIRRQIIERIATGFCEGPTAVDEAILRLEELMSSCQDDRVLEALVARALAGALAMAGRFDEARDYLQASTPVLDEADDTTITWSSSRWYLVYTKRLAGDEAGAEQELIAIFLRFRDIRGDFSDGRAMLAAARLAHLYCDQGRWDEAVEYLTYGDEVDRAEPVYGKVYAYERLAARARIAAHLGKYPEALELGRIAIEAMAQTHWLNLKADVWLAFAEVQLAAGNVPEADAAVAHALELYEQKGNIAAATHVRAAYPDVAPAP